MTVSYVVLVVASEPDRGELVGRVTEVESGEATVFHNGEELLAVLVNARVARTQRKAANRPDDT